MSKKKKKNTSLGKHAANNEASGQVNVEVEDLTQPSHTSKKKKDKKPRHAANEKNAVEVIFDAVQGMSSEATQQANAQHAKQVSDADSKDQAEEPTSAHSKTQTENSSAEDKASSSESEDQKSTPLESADTTGTDTSAQSASPEVPIQPMVPAEQVSSKKSGRGKKVLKGFGITFAILFALCAITYGAGYVFFMDRFWPNTTIGDQDVSLKTSSESAPILSEVVAGYHLDVKGQGISLSLSSKDIGLSVNGEQIAKNALEHAEPWMWPLEIFKEHDQSDYLIASYDRSAVTEAVNLAVATHNETAEPPVNATIAFSESSNKFEIVPEQLGTELDSNAVMRLVDQTILGLETKAELSSNELQRALIGEKSVTLQKACDSANDLIKTDLTLTMDGFEVAALNPATISSWVVLNENLEVSFNEEAFNAWVETVVAGCNTVGTERTYTRPDGKVVTVSGGSYGWEVDSDALRTQLRDGLTSGQSGTLEIPVTKSGTGFSGLGGQDWGGRYVDIDLSEQYARFYDEGGNVMWESAIVSGNPNKGNSTPIGVNAITRKTSPETLVGRILPETGEPEYRTKVTYWMPFVGNSIGLHDATWQYAFGGDRYRIGYGSHGCVNLPYSAAQNLWGIIEVGDVVVVHW